MMKLINTTMHPFTYLLALIFSFALYLSLSSCELVSPEIDPATMLDGPLIFDTATHLLSDSIPIPNAAQKNIPVIICAHGFTATTYEWEEWNQYIQSANAAHSTEIDSQVLVSRVLLGGHGLDYEAFKASTWGGWQAPIMAEYQKLVSMGYTNISLAGSSTGGALILELLGRGVFGKDSLRPAPKNVFLIDAIVYPSAEILTLVDWVGWFIGNDISEGTVEENKHWYTNRPMEALGELMDVVTTVRKQLENSYRLPDSTHMIVYKAKHDNSASPLSALMIKRGLRDSKGREVDIHMVDTKKHVFTRLAGRSSATAADTTLQQKTFAELRSVLLKK